MEQTNMRAQVTNLMKSNDFWAANNKHKFSAQSTAHLVPFSFFVKMKKVSKNFIQKS
jgi:hypothetical protein